MAITSGSFTTVFDTITHPVMRKGETVSVAISGTYDQTIDLQREIVRGSGAFETLKTFNTENATEAHDHVVDKDKEVLRLYMRVDGGGTATVSLTDSVQTTRVFKDQKGTAMYKFTDDGVHFERPVIHDQVAKDSTSGVGTVNASAVGLTVEEFGDGVIHKTVFTLVDTLATTVTVTTGAGVGGIKLYDFPEGAILRLGCTADLAMSIATGDQADFTDNTPEGQVGIGTLLPANADALGTDATDDNWATAEDFTGIAWTDVTVEVNSEAVGIHVEAATPLNIQLNNLIDAGDQDDDNTSSVTWNGTITIVWANLGNMTVL